MKMIIFLASFFKRKADPVLIPETEDEKEFQAIIDEYTKKWHGPKKKMSELWNI